MGTRKYPSRSTEAPSDPTRLKRRAELLAEELARDPGYVSGENSVERWARRKAAGWFSPAFKTKEERDAFYSGLAKEAVDNLNRASRAAEHEDKSAK